MTTNLTDRQLVILGAAAARSDLMVLPLPDTLKLNAGAAALVLKSLIARNLIEECPAERGQAIWQERDSQRLTLKITEAGLHAIGVEPPAPDDTVPAEAPSADVAAPPAPAAIRPGTKLALVLDLLHRPEGANIAEITAATDWQAHSVRGFISGTLKKKLSLVVSSEAEGDRGRIYRIVPAVGDAA
ncbi:DUF3489 domain-containing protein [Oleomonas cavernae]|uniref:DUF3489 domain-containing protein n=1 Tax=Oleomonas cavernae TaxID=2320859 RepID=A0A418WF36_9PROT|nr:DUF3489 domain-containing protein [Oleomonas cavernae]RJF88638.1 DUF3489 domain-containing protein [Oleomonas cavernae]